MGSALDIREDIDARDLRGWARRCRNGRAAARAYAIANALEGMPRGEAARLAGMERQALRDAVVRYTAEGLDGLFDRPKGHPRETLTDGEQAALLAAVYAGPDLDGDGVCTWTREALVRWIERKFGKTMAPQSMSRVLKRLGLSRQKARPAHPKTDRKARYAFQKRGSATP
jgi:transposase